MPLVSEAVIRTLRTLKRESFSDTFVRLIYTPQTGPTNYGKPTYPEGLSSPCRVVLKPSPDVLPGTDVEVTDADLWCGREVTLLPNDRVKVTHLHGDLVTAQTYAIVAGPVLDSLGQRATLKLVRE